MPKQTKSNRSHKVHWHIEFSRAKRQQTILLSRYCGREVLKCIRIRANSMPYSNWLMPEKCKNDQTDFCIFRIHCIWIGVYITANTSPPHIHTSVQRWSKQMELCMCCVSERIAFTTVQVFVLVRARAHLRAYSDYARASERTACDQLIHGCWAEKCCKIDLSMRYNQTFLLAHNRFVAF